MDYQKEQTFGVGPDLDLNTSDMSWGVASGTIETPEAPEGQNPLNASEIQTSFAPAESAHTPRSIGNKIINFPVENQNQLPITSETETIDRLPRTSESLKPIEKPQKLGQIISLEPAEEPKNTSPALDHSVIQARGDRIAKESVTEIKKLENKLNRDGDAANFYDNVREINGVYAKNAFGRHLYSDKSEVA